MKNLLKITLCSVLALMMLALASCGGTKPATTDKVPAGTEAAPTDTEKVVPAPEVKLESGSYVSKANNVFTIDADAKTVTLSVYEGYDKYQAKSPDTTWTEKYTSVSANGVSAARAVHDGVTYDFYMSDGSLIYSYTISGGAFSGTLKKVDEISFFTPELNKLYVTESAPGDYGTNVGIKFDGSNAYVYTADTINESTEPRYTLKNYKLSITATGLVVIQTLESGEKFSVNVRDRVIRVVLQHNSEAGIVGFSANCK
ncbi:MAG: hypothetical protein IJQ37_05530 [Clostridia bacterium]|nr:hypothetical protein [Clostridia bacterium]